MLMHMRQIDFPQHFILFETDKYLPQEKQALHSEQQISNRSSVPNTVIWMNKLHTILKCP